MSFSAELKNVSKAFGPCRANEDVSLHVRQGTIHALVGENGAGKSTAMKILFGIHRPDGGEVRFSAKSVTAWEPRKASEYGVGMVHQHFMLAGPESVIDNLTLGFEKTRFGFVRDRAGERAELERLMKQTGLEVPLDRRLEDLPISLQSRCEILKVLYRKASFLILDEPTAVLTPQEVQEFLGTLRRLREQGCTMLIVTHKLKEVLAVADDITVLRAGRTVATRKAAETSVEELSELMVGRKLTMPKIDGAFGGTGRPILELGALKLLPGQITGIAGVEGNGQEALAAEIVASCLREKIPYALIPADRHKEGLVLDFNLAENFRLRRQTLAENPWYRRFGPPEARELDLLKTYDVRPSDPRLAVRALSGGNQQKLIAARELGQAGKGGVILAIHPTRGVDVGAIAFLHSKILEAAAHGSAVVVISSELEELMALSHRIGVLYRGELVRWFDSPPYDELKIGVSMMGGQS